MALRRINGTAGRDVITGTSFREFILSRAGNDNVNAKGGNDIINGGEGSDDLFGGTGHDQVLAGYEDRTFDINTLSGVEPIQSNPGRGELDDLVGGPGIDKFALGNTSKVFYDDGNNTTIGDNDNALIKNFTSGVDTIEVKGVPSDYGLNFGDFGFGSSIADDTQIVRINNSGGPHEVIGYVQDVTSFVPGDFTHL